MSRPILEAGQRSIMLGSARALVVCGLCVVGGLVASARPVGAQTVQNPQTVEFDPSPDHGSVVDGTPLVQRYEMDIFVSGNAQPAQTLSLGKPAPAGDGRIRVNFAALLTTPLTPGTVYTALVAAVGPGGRASSAMAPDLFVFTAPCSFTVSPTNPSSLAAAGGGASVSVTAPAGCSWTAAEAVSWLSITGGASGTGSGTVSYTASANTTTSPRSATMTVAGQTVTITQDPAPCSFTVSPTNPSSLAAAGGGASVSVTAPAGCAWTATESASWLSITSGASGTGNGTVSYAATTNTTGSARSTAMTVAGQTVMIAQEATTCSFSVTPGSLSINATGGSATIAVTTVGTCAWTSTGASSWLSITSGSSGSGSGFVTIAIASNTTSSSRTTTLTVAGQNVAVTQPAGVPAAPTNVRVVGSGGGD